MTSGKSFPPETEIEFVFHRSSDEFMFLQKKTVCTKKLKIVLTNLKLSYDYQVVTPQVQAAHKSKSSRSNPKALIKRNQIRYYVCHRGDSEMSRAGVFNTSLNNLPEHVILFVMPLKAWNGDREYNPFDWTNPFEFAEIGLIVNGWNEPATFLNNQDDMGKLELYHHFLDNMGYGDNKFQAEIPISYEQFYGGKFMIPFDRTAAKHNGFYTTLPDKGTMDIHLKLKQGATLPENYVVVVFASYTEEINIHDGNYFFTPLEAGAV